MTLAYYLTIDGVRSDSLRIEGYQFDVSNPLNPSGGVGGKATFSPLNVNLDLNPDLTPLFIKAASGETIRSIRLDGYTQDGAMVHSIKLGDVSIIRYYDTDIQNGDSLGFSYGQIVLTNIPQRSDGTLGPPITVSWDVVANREGVTVPDPRAASNVPSPDINSGADDDLLSGTGDEGRRTGVFEMDSLTNGKDTRSFEITTLDDHLVDKPDWISDLKNIDAISFLKGYEANLGLDAEMSGSLIGAMSSDSPFSPSVTLFSSLLSPSIPQLSSPLAHLS